MISFAGESPIIFHYNCDADEVYAPIITSSVDLTLVTDGILDKLYTSSQGDRVVEITRTKAKVGDYIHWYGYLQPNQYSQEVKTNLNEISLTAIDMLAMMKYIKIDEILTRPNILTFKDILGKALACVQIYPNKLYVERVVSYGGLYDGTNGLLDLSIQVSNFWDEGGEPETIYTMIEEMLKVFNLTLICWNNDFIIYDPKFQFTSADLRVFDCYTVRPDGQLTEKTENQVQLDDIAWNPEYSKSDESVVWYVPNNNSTPTMQINETYDKITGVASSSVPEYNSSAFDKVSYTDRDKYDAAWLNIERNKIKGYSSPYNIDTKPYWFFMWNGVYTNVDYDLVSNGGYVNGWVNINGAYRYFNDDNDRGHMEDYGSVLNFYGGTANAIATDKQQAEERVVEVNKRITAYAPDNGLPPEFLEKDDFKWSFDDGYAVASEGVVEDPTISFASPYTVEKYGVQHDMKESSRIVYHQEYPNMQLIQGDQQTIEINLKQAYSRTGINTEIGLYSNSLTSNNKFLEVSDGDGGVNYILMNCDLWYIPSWWNSSNVRVTAPYFTKTPKWDRRRIDMYVKNNDGTIYQFNGKEWVEGTAVSADNCFYLCKLMNGEKLFNTDHSYDMIECSDGKRYSLTDEQITVRTNSKGEVVSSGGTSTTYTRYAAISNEWVKYISSTQAGNIKIYLPDMDAVNVSVVTDIYNSTFLGMSGDDNSSYGYSHTFTYQFKGQVERIDPEGGESFWYDIDTSEMRTKSPRASFIPYSADYVKAEHLDIEVEVSVPESNLGQMFSQSDIEYTLNKSKGYLEEYEGPTFRINTKNQLVKSSNSYLIYKDKVCEGDEFVFHDKLNARPECYTVQAYYNWLGTIRRVFDFTIRMEGSDTMDGRYYLWYVCPARTYIYLHNALLVDKWLKIISDTWDLKTNRHTIKAIECENMNVDKVDSFATIEIPRRARNDLYNLPTAKKS